MAHISAVFLLLLQLISLPVVTRAEQNDTKIVQPGSSISPTTQPSSWASSSGYFEFGFYHEGNGFALGIWIVGSQGRNTVVWTANRDDLPLSSNATLELTGQGEMVLQDDQRGIYRNYLENLVKSVDSASMLDSGNFVLYNNGFIIWQSFDFPTDTILGGQNLSRGKQNQTLISSVSSSNHSTGKYRLDMQTDGNLVAYPNNIAEVYYPDAYWVPVPSGLDFDKLILNENGSLVLYDEYPSTVLVLANSSHVGNKEIVIYRATLDPDGMFRIYSHQFGRDSSPNGTKTWQNLKNTCDVKGTCGLNSYCASGDGHVECHCYPGFTFMDENRKLLGCSPNNLTIDACEERKDQRMHYNMTVVDKTMWYGFPYYSSTQSTEEHCKNACEQDCDCRGSILDSLGNCKMYTLPLKYGKRSKIMSTRAFIKVISGITVNGPPPQSSPTTLESEGSQRLVTTMGISLGSVACFCLLLAISSLLIYRHRVQNFRLLVNRSPGAELFTLQSFSFSELDKATDGFKEELGKGSFGAVYKGILPGDKHNRAIAVKKLDEVNERDGKFQTEMTVIGRTNHRNLVRLLGFCVEGSRKLLVYEYLSNGSLVNFLFNPNKERPIWKDRAKIAMDVAKGILYLHEECEVCIIHGNIKPQNIILDDSLTAKISDYGLAKLWSPNDQANNTGFRRTAGYSAPELQRNASLSVKVDVYCFGVMLLEIVCCRSSIEIQVSNADEILLSTWVYNCFVAGELNQLVEGEEVDSKMLERFVKVGLWCIQDDPKLRPFMKNVTLMLEGTMDVPVPPSPSASSANSHVTINCQ